VFASAIQKFETLRAMCTEVGNKYYVFKENDFHWLFTPVVYQQIENNERANQIHRFTIDHYSATTSTGPLGTKLTNQSVN